MVAKLARCYWGVDRCRTGFDCVYVARRFPVRQTVPANRAAIREQTCPTLRILPQSWRSAQKVLQGFVGRRHPLLVWILLFHVCGQDPAARATLNEHAGLSTLAPHRSPHAGCCCSPKWIGLLWLSPQKCSPESNLTRWSVSRGLSSLSPTAKSERRCTESKTSPSVHLWLESNAQTSFVRISGHASEGAGAPVVFSSHARIVWARHISWSSLATLIASSRQMLLSEAGRTDYLGKCIARRMVNAVGGTCRPSCMTSRKRLSGSPSLGAGCSIEATASA